MPTRLRAIVTGFLCLVIFGCTGVPEGIDPVERLDLEQYQGNWYEIARLDHSFEEGLSNVTATYTVQKDGAVEVINRGFSEVEGKWEEATGRAVPVGEAGNGHLKVSFFGPFYASYVVFYLSDDLQEAYVTGFDRDYLWFLSRQPEVSEQSVDRFRDYAKRSGFDLGDLIMVDQSINLGRSGGLD